MHLANNQGDVIFYTKISYWQYIFFRLTLQGAHRHSDYQTFKYISIIWKSSDVIDIFSKMKWSKPAKLFKVGILSTRRLKKPDIKTQITVGCLFWLLPTEGTRETLNFHPTKDYVLLSGHPILWIWLINGKTLNAQLYKVVSKRLLTSFVTRQWQNKAARTVGGSTNLH